MDIKYLGHSSFFIRSKEAKLVTDPFDPQMVGLKFPKVEADIVTVSHHHADHDRANLVGGNPLVIDLPGEYERKGLRVFGYQTYHDKKMGAERGENTVYKIEGDGISVLHCGDLGLVLEDSFIDQLGEVDVLLVPVGGFYTIDSTEAVELVKKIEPSIIVPMHYNEPKLNQQVFGKLLPINEFLGKIGAGNVAPIPKLTVKKEELQEEMKVVVMEITS
ncbi:MBL fold metallo-hydrolase [Candidatus Roizmanbacteria bacterium]|nr:MBL fold metallo-hydrolase [Candidatus Roizmanbacteria bacterium]